MNNIIYNVILFLLHLSSNTPVLVAVDVFSFFAFFFSYIVTLFANVIVKYPLMCAAF